MVKTVPSVTALTTKTTTRSHRLGVMPGIGCDRKAMVSTGVRKDSGHSYPNAIAMAAVVPTVKRTTRALARTMAGREADPAATAEEQELHRWLRELVRQLPANQREVIDLWMDDFSYREIAGITGRSEGSVRVMAHRALNRIREHPRTVTKFTDLGVPVSLDVRSRAVPPPDPWNPHERRNLRRDLLYLQVERGDSP